MPTRRSDLSFVWPWLLGFGLTIYVGLNGGGYDVLVSGQVGIAVWWVLLLAVAIGAAPVRKPSTLALCALVLLVAFVVWTTLSLRWTESTEKTAIDVAEFTALLGTFALAVFTRGRGGVRKMVGAIAAGIAVIGLVALLSRLHPGLFPGADQTGRFLASNKERLSYPLDYWNGLAALIAISLPLLLQIATEARLVALRSLAAAGPPALFLTLYLTLSRNGIAAGVIALAVYLAFASNRLPKFLTLAVTGIGGGLLIFLAGRRHELVHGFTESVARSQGTQIFWSAIVVCFVTGLVQLGLVFVRRPTWARISRRNSQITVGVAVVVAIVGLLAIDAPGHLSHAWSDFKRPSASAEHGTSRLTSVGGEDRWQFWSSAVREFGSAPLLGTGANTFQLWWTRDGSVSQPLIDTHNLYLQTLAELGLVGLALLVAFILVTLVGGAVRTVRAGPERRAWLAAALAGSTVLWTTSTFDWMWKIPLIPIVTLLLAAVLITAEAEGAVEAREPAPFAPPIRVGVVVAALLAVVAIAIPLAGTQLLRDSQERAREGDAVAALKDAESAASVQPGAASPRIQEALLYEGAGQYPKAEAAALTATEREPTNWRTWLLLSRIQARDEKPSAALTSYRKARSLNPRSYLFARR